MLTSRWHADLGGVAVEWRWIRGRPRVVGVYVNNAPLDHYVLAVEQDVEDCQDQFELILNWFMKRRDGDGSGKQQPPHNAS